MKKEKPLTHKERGFCIEYCRNGNNATQAAIKAGYSQKTAGIIGFENLRKPKIAAEVQRLNTNFEELAAEMGITKGRVLSEHAKIAYSTIADLHNTWIERKEFDKLTEDQKAAIAEIDSKIEPKQITLPDGKTKSVKMEYVRVKLYDKQKALEAITKMMGWNEAEKHDLTSKGEKIQQVVTFIDAEQKAAHDKMIESLKNEK